MYSLTLLEGDISPRSNLVSPMASLFDVSMVIFFLGPHIIIPPVCVWVLISSSYKDPSQIGLGPILQSHFTLVTYLKTPISKYSHIWRSWVLGIQHTDLQGT